MRTITTRRYLVATGTPSLGGYVIWDCRAEAYVTKDGTTLRLATEAEAQQLAERLEAGYTPDGDDVAMSIPADLWESWASGNPPSGLRPASDTTVADTDETLIRWLRVCKPKNVRHRRAEQLLQLPALARWDALNAAVESVNDPRPDAHAVADVLTRIVSTHPNRRPVPCGARYLPCQVGDGKTEEYGVVDMWAETEPRVTPWVTWGSDDSEPMRWATFETAAQAARETNWEHNGSEPRGIVQQAWQPSVVRVGDRINGKCVTYGSEVVGHVLSINGPFREDCGHYRYQVAADDGRKSIVFAQQLL